MTFSAKPWADRLDLMGDLAEQQFEATHTEPFARWGLNRPDFPVRLLPAEVRYAPDYVTADRFIEVQGCGKDQTLKIKLDKYIAWHHWAKLMPLWLWIWDAHNGTFLFVSLDRIDYLVGSGEGDWRRFPEGTAYLAVELARLRNVET